MNRNRENVNQERYCKITNATPASAEAQRVSDQVVEQAVKRTSDKQ